MELFRFVLPHALAGAAGGVVAAVAMVATNLGSLRDLVFHTDDGWLGFALLVFSFVLTFVPIATGYAIITMSDEEG